MQVTETLNEGLKRGYRITVTAAELDAKVNDKLKLVPGGAEIVHALVERFGAELLDDSPVSCTLQLTGRVDDVDAFVREAARAGTASPGMRTKASSTTISLEPVPCRPMDCQVSIIW